MSLSVSGFGGDGGNEEQTILAHGTQNIVNTYNNGTTIYTATEKCYVVLALTGGSTSDAYIAVNKQAVFTSGTYDLRIFDENPVDVSSLTGIDRYISGDYATVISLEAGDYISVTTGNSSGTGNLYWKAFTY